MFLLNIYYTQTNKKHNKRVFCFQKDEISLTIKELFLSSQGTEIKIVN